MSTIAPPKKKQIQVNKVYQPLFIHTENIRYIILMGGRSAGRSFAVSQYVVSKLRSSEFFRCAIMRFILSDVRLSIYQEIVDRIEEQGLQNTISTKDSALRFTHKSNSVKGLGFRKSSGDQKSKLKSLAQYTTVVLEEADEILEEDFVQLDDSLRSKKGPITVIMCLNVPDKDHWILKRFFNLLPPSDPQAKALGLLYPELKESVKHNTVYIRTSYKDNLANISESTIDNFEEYRKTKPEHYWGVIHGLATKGKRGRIFSDWKPTTREVYEGLPFPEIYGLDFGFSNDPAALIGTKRHNLKGWAHQYIYEAGLTNRMLSKRMAEIGISKDAIIYADSSEPKSIQELRDDGWNVIPADKGPDSVGAGIDMLLDFEFFYTEESTDIQKENLNYCWALDKNKEPTNTPIDKWNHAKDAIRYAIWTDSHTGYVGF